MLDPHVVEKEFLFAALALHAKLLGLKLIFVSHSVLMEAMFEMEER